MNPRIAGPSSESPATTVRERPSPDAVRHPVLSRLVEEVRNEHHVEASYDRVHNRHNRGR